MAWRRTDYLDQYRSSETICLRPTDIAIIYAIKQNETNISSSTIYLKTNKITNTTRTQILHRVYGHHICITKPQQQTRPNWRHTPPCEILLSHLVVTGPWRNEARNLENCILRLVVDIGWSHLVGLEKIIASSLGWLRYCRADNMSALWDHMLSCCNHSHIKLYIWLLSEWQCLSQHG